MSWICEFYSDGAESYGLGRMNLHLLSEATPCLEVSTCRVNAAAWSTISHDAFASTVSWSAITRNNRNDSPAQQGLPRVIHRNISHSVAEVPMMKKCPSRSGLLGSPCCASRRDEHSGRDVVLRPSRR